MTHPSNLYWFFYLPFFLLAAAERISRTFTRESKSPGTFELKEPHYLFGLAFYLYLGVVIVGIVERIVRGSDTIQWPICALGLMIYLLGVVVRNSAIRALGRFWDLRCGVYSGQALIKLGAYRWLKHPYYVAVMLELIGNGLILMSTASILAALCIQLPVLMLRASIEERALSEHFGEAYKIYLKSRLI
jgi:isoprenylcysteine carboxyl methyltransferase (ICMT) family protein YpbQ